jgi:hypothetical protein
MGATWLRPQSTQWYSRATIANSAAWPRVYQRSQACGEMLGCAHWAVTCPPSPREVGADHLTARTARDTRSAMSAVLTGEREQVDTKPPKRQPAFAHEDRVALNEDSPFLLLAAAVVSRPAWIKRIAARPTARNTITVSGPRSRRGSFSRRFARATRRGVECGSIGCSTPP